MNPLEIAFLVALFWVGPIFVGHDYGKRKGRAGWAWGLFLSWIGVIVVARLAPTQAATRELHEAEQARTHRVCQFCNEPMQREASVCPHCHRASDAWRQDDDGFWWRKDSEGRWTFLHEATGRWLRLEDAQALDPSATGTGLSASPPRTKVLLALGSASG